MKKHIFWLIMVAVLVCLMAVSVSAAEELCPCGCGQALSQVQWQSWNVNETGKPATGHYDLSGDYAQNIQYTVDSGTRVVLDLKGYNLTTAEESRLFLVYGELYIIDTAGGGCLSTKTTGKAVGGVLQIYYKNGDCGSVHLQDVTVMLRPENKGSANGGLIYVGDACSLKLEGCTLLGGNSTGNGGAIYAGPDSRVEITDSFIFGSRAAKYGGIVYSAGDVTVTGSRLWGGTSQLAGGNIYKTGGKLIIKDSDLAFGTAQGDASAYSGGNLCALGNATVIVENSRLRDGFGNKNGGNAALASGNYTFTGTSVTGGTAGGVGANLACTSASAVVTLDSCTVSGDAYFREASLTLTGATRIGLMGNGLDLYTGSTTLAINAAGLTQGAEIFVEANGVFTKDTANIEYFKPAIRTAAITESGGKLTAAYADSGQMGGYCPHCYDPESPETVVWTELDHTAWDADNNVKSGHYYLTSDPGTLLNLPQDVDFVLDLNGKTFHSNQRAFKAEGSNAALSILDSAGGGKLCGTGAGGYGGGVIYSNQEGFRLNIYGGTLIYQKDSAKDVLSGGVVSVAGSNSQITLCGGVLDGSAQTYTTGNYGGTLFLGNVGSNKTFTMTGGRIIGGNAQYGGGVYLGHYVTAAVTGGVLTGGTGVEDGGNLRVNGNSGTDRTQISLSNCMLRDGTVTGNFSGGNVYFINANVTLDSCYLESGSAANTGGNLRTGASTKLVAQNMVLSGGKAVTGGNLYVAATNADNSFENCRFLGGQATGNGGNLFFNHGKNTLSGGEVSFGFAGGNGGNVYTNAGNYTTKGMFVKFTGNVLLTGGEAAGKGGNLYTVGITELESCRFVSGSSKSGQDIYLAKGATSTLLTFLSGVTGTVSFAADTALLTQTVYGGGIACTASDGVTAAVTLEGGYGDPGVLVKDHALCVAGVSVANAGGEESWYVENAAALAACGEGEYLKLYASGTLELTRDCAVDLNGQTLTVTGSGKLLGMDSTGDSYEDATGKAQWTGTVNTQMRFVAPNGCIYYALQEGGTVTYHRLNMVITDVVLRPSAAGLYYKAVWECDSILAAQIQHYGIGVSLTDMPGADLRTDADTLLAEYEGSQLPGQTGCSVLIENIFRENESALKNKRRGEMAIYATAYVEFRDGTVYTSDEAGEEDDVRYSLYGFMVTADRAVTAQPVKYRKVQQQLWAFYEAWKDKGTGSWTFDKVQTPVAAADDGIMKILMIGQSHAQDTIWLLYDVLKAQMPDQEFLVVDVYRSVPLDDHVQNIKDQAAVYDYYQNTDGKMVHTPNMTITEALVKENWDVIMFNEATWPQTRDSSYQNGNFEFMIGHIREYAQPGYRLCYNATWAQPVSAEVYAPARRQPPAGFRDNFISYFNGNRLTHFAQICKMMNTYIETNDAFDIVFYSGTAIQYASETFGVPEGDPERNYDLYRDYTHLSDFGRLLVGYQLYAQIYGLEEITQVNVDLIPQHMRATDREKAFGDIVITQQHKDAIIASVNYALKHPHEAPPQTARETPILEPLS